MKSSYSIIVPLYNEIQNISTLLSELYKFRLAGHQILIIDDGSRDGSSEVLSKCDFIKLISFKDNCGKGIAIREGLKNVDNNKIIIFDSDLEIPPAEIQKLMILDPTNNIRCVLANRFNSKKVISIWDIGNNLLTKIFNLIHFSNVRDALCCVKSFLKSDLNNLVLRSAKFDIDVEILSILIKKNTKVKNVNIKYHRRTKVQGKKLRLRDSFRIIYRILIT